MDIFYRNLKEKATDDFLRTKFESMEKYYVCEKKNCDSHKKKFVEHPETKDLNLKLINAKTDADRNDAYNKLMKTKIAKDYYNCLYSKCKIDFINTTKYFIQTVEKDYLKIYKKPQKYLFEKLKAIIIKEPKDITEADMLKINEIRLILGRFNLTSLFQKQKK